LSLLEFQDAPWSKSHHSYASGSLTLSPAPEYATSEVLLSSLYRLIGLPDVSERTVPSRGTELQRRIKKSREQGKKPSGATLDTDAFDNLLNSVLESPKRSNQSAKRFLQVTPLIPQFAVFSGSPRLAGNPWTAGQLLRRMVWLGSADAAAARAIWRELFDALSIDESDDVFARFLKSEANAWLPDARWEFVPAPTDGMPTSPYHGVGTFPARQFVSDLQAVIACKPLLTRRQWTSILEAVLRLGSVAHVMWLCELHSRIWSSLRDALQGGGPETTADACQILFPDRFSFLPLSSKPLLAVRDCISRYLTARIGINAILWALEDVGSPGGDLFGSADGLTEICREVRQHRKNTHLQNLERLVEEIRERESRTLLCRKGVGSNIYEFVTYCLQQRQTANPRLRGYDQGYFLRKQGTYSSSPWIVTLGPVAVIALVHCSLSGVGGPRSVHRLAQHLAQYGVSMDHRDIPQNDLGHQLRMLGLVLDSPDAESGMLLVPPFRRTARDGNE
jgi:hypothetical protein